MNNDRFKFRVWSERNRRYLNKSQDGLIDLHPDYVVEQCTALKDKNGRLIYEGDIVADKNNKFFIEYSDEEACFTVNLIGNSSSIRTLGCSDYWLATKTIIGNIHENKDLLSITNTTKY